MLLVVALVSLSCIFSEPLGRPAAAVAMLLVVALVSLSCIFSEPLGSSSRGLVVVGGGASVALLLSVQTLWAAAAMAMLLVALVLLSCFIFRASGQDQQQLWPCCW